MNKEKINKMKKTAVEWLESQLNIWQAIADDETNLTLDTVRKLLQQAKAMEKEQIVDAWNNGYDELDRATSTPYNYYNETFKSE